MHSIPAPVVNIPPPPSTPSETHKCPYQSCGKYFSKKYNLKAHLRLHTGEQPFECPRADCRKKFKWRSSLSSHSVWHTRKEQKRPRSLIAKKARKVVSAASTNTAHPSTNINHSATLHAHHHQQQVPTQWFNLFQSSTSPAPPSPGSPVTSEENTTAASMVHIKQEFESQQYLHPHANANGNNTQLTKQELDVELFDGAVLPPLCTVSVGKMEDELLIHEGDVHAAILADDLFANDHNVNIMQMQSRNHHNNNMNIPAVSSAANAVADLEFSMTQFDLDNLQPL